MSISKKKKKRVKKRNKGLFITFEGGEGAGKTTLINRVFDELSSKGHSVIRTLEPGGTSLGKEIRELLLHQKKSAICRQSELFLYLSDRSQHVQELILPSLNAGRVVLCDRFNDSTLAYQGAARALNVDLLRGLCLAATDGLCPDLTLYLDLDPEVGLSRAKQKNTYDRLEAEKLEFHLKVREAFLSLAEKEPDRFHTIDASKDVDTVYYNAMKEIESLL
ncbi:MAG: dTMP kinase [Chlamydiia bacterium]|nr:dTMP kinase [Chlamydiia bacterium]